MNNVSPDSAAVDTKGSPVDEVLEKNTQPVDDTASPEQKSSSPKPRKQPPPPAAPERPLEDVTRLKLKVGKILKIWPHEDADSLFCEEIDLGEETPRQILSGLRKFYQPEQLEGKHVIVLANMKEKNLRGKKSQGMVMCASTTDHSQVEILLPPPTAKPGDDVVFEGLNASDPGPDTVLNTKKNKDPLPAILPHLKTNENKEACWKTHSMIVNGEVCVATTLANANIS